MLTSPAHTYDFYRTALAGAALPAAIIDLDCIDANIETFAQRAGGRPIRLVTKSVRCPTILQYALTHKAFLPGLLCYAPGEAAWLASLGFDDLVVAYPSVAKHAINAVAEQIAAGKTITLMVDGVEQLDILAGIAQARTITLPVCIDIDMSSDFPGLRFGVYRSPINTPAKALALAAQIAQRPSLQLAGLMGYEGQIAGLMDNIPGRGTKNRIIRALKAKSIKEIAQRRQSIAAALRRAGHTLRFVNGGGTGSFESTSADPSVTELAAGSGLYMPTLFDHYAAFKARPAAFFAVQITRIPQPGMVTCAGGGYPASGPAGTDRLPTPYLPPGCTLITQEGAGEVQTPLRVPASPALNVADPIFFRHAKAGELCERFNEILLIRQGELVDRVPTYRGMGQCFF